MSGRWVAYRSRQCIRFNTESSSESYALVVDHLVYPATPRNHFGVSTSTPRPLGVSTVVNRPPHIDHLVYRATPRHHYGVSCGVSTTTHRPLLCMAQCIDHHTSTTWCMARCIDHHTSTTWCITRCIDHHTSTTTHGPLGVSRNTTTKAYHNTTGVALSNSLCL